MIIDSITLDKFFGKEFYIINFPEKFIKLCIKDKFLIINIDCAVLYNKFVYESNPSRKLLIHLFNYYIKNVQNN